MAPTKISKDGLHKANVGYPEGTVLNVSIAKAGSDVAADPTLLKLTKATVKKQMQSNNEATCTVHIEFAGVKGQIFQVPSTEFDIYTYSRFTTKVADPFTIELDVMDPVTYVHQLSNPRCKEIFRDAMKDAFPQLYTKFDKDTSVVKEDRDAVEFQNLITIYFSFIETCVSIKSMPDTLLPAFNSTLQMFCRLHLRVVSDASKLKVRLEEFCKKEEERMPVGQVSYDVTKTTRDSLRAALEK